MSWWKLYKNDGQWLTVWTERLMIENVQVEKDRVGQRKDGV